MRDGKIVRGCWQKEMYEKLLRGERIPSCSMFLRGKARDYSTKYERSLANMINRVENEGYRFEPSLGPKGGHGIKLIKDEE